MIFQDPMASLNPVLKIGSQIVEQIGRTRRCRRRRGSTAPSSCSSGSASRALASAELLPARVLRRHAPARDDRARAVVRPERPHRRRADDGAGRDGPGADHRALPRAARRDERRPDPRHARPRRRRGHRRQHRGHVLRADRRAGHARPGLLRPAASVHVGAHRRDRARRPPEAPAAATIPGLPPSLAHRPKGCHLRPRCPHEFDACTKVPPLEARLPDADGHRDRCWLPTERKRKLREIAPGEIGLEAKAAPTTKDAA